MKRIYQGLKALAGILCVVYISSCKQLDEANVAPGQEVSGETAVKSERAYPNERGELKKGKLFGTEITYEEVNGQAVFEGDIILTPEQLAGEHKNARTEAAGSANTALRWPGGIVYYRIDRSLPNQDRVLAAIEYMERNTPIRFVVDMTQRNYVLFMPGRGSSSSIGMVGGQQLITLEPGFQAGNVLHEIGHTIGLLHEHTRTDRDQTLRINYANIIPGAEQNFSTYTRSQIPGFNYKNLDVSSVMMMDAYWYSANGLATMTRLDGSTFSIQRLKLSLQDIECIKIIYSGLFAMQYDRLWAVNAKTGDKNELSSATLQVEAITSDKDFVYAVKFGWLMKYDKLSGVNTSIRYGFAGTRAMAFYKEDLYVIRDGYLLKVNTNDGTSTQIGQRVWFQTTGMTYEYGFLYIINGDQIFRVTPETGVFVPLVAGYMNATEITSLKGNLYAIKNTKLYRINPMTGVEFHMSSFWSAGSQMTTYNNLMYVIEGDYLFKVDEYGTRELIASGWQGTRQLTANDKKP